MPTLTDRQRQIFDFLRQTMQARGAPPTRQEICDAFGFASPNAAEAHLRALAKKGAIALEGGTARGIRLIGDAADAGAAASADERGRGLPLIGSVAAGSPLLAIENRLGIVPVDAALFSPPADYLLKVRGLSMIDAGILDGDFVAVHRCSEARNGEIVVARLGDEVTVKRLRRRRGVVELVAENASFAPIVVHEPLVIEGIVVGLIRNGRLR